MIRSLQELNSSGQEYKHLHWDWRKTYYPIETSEFSGDGSFEFMRFDEYMGRMSKKLNRESGTENYVVVVKDDVDPESHYITLIKLLGGEDDSV